MPIPVRRILQLWGLCLIATLVAILILIRWVDVPVATFFRGMLHHQGALERAFGRPALMLGEVTLMAFLALARLVRGGLSDRGKAFFLASVTSLLALMVNDYFLKMIFGRPVPWRYFHHPSARVFFFLRGDHHSSFPSGHMVLAAAFAATMIRLYPRSWPFFTLLLLAGAMALVMGDWHFSADVVAGLFVGGSAGVGAAELWLRRGRLKHAYLETPLAEPPGIRAD